MLPKPSPNWQAANSSNAQGKAIAPPPLSEEEAAKAMPPPAVPNPVPPILEAELNGLATSLRNAMVKTGQIYGFYASAQKMGIAHHTSVPPPSLSASLGGEIEKYDQLCDCIEAYLLRAIAVLQRDARREDLKIKEAEAEAKAKARAQAQAQAEAAMAEANNAQELAESTQQAQQPISTNSAHPSATPVARRASAISMTALHRPSVPPRLDLSSNAFRMSAEDVLYPSGLASPVTLAPKSARPLGTNELPPDFMAAFSTPAPSDHTRVDIDLTVGDTSQQDDTMSLDPTAGSSADKPIELDFDMGMNDIFVEGSEVAGDASQVNELFASPGANGEPSTPTQMHKEAANFLQALGVPEHDSTQQILASLTENGQNQGENFDQNIKVPQTADTNAPSPGTLVSNFAASQMAASPSNQGNVPHAAPFDFAGLDLPMSNFHGDWEGVDMSNFDMNAYLGMEAPTEAKETTGGEPPPNP